MATKVNAFDVMKEMSNRDMDIRVAPLGNITNLQKVKAGTKVTIGVEGDMVTALYVGDFVGGLFLCNKKQYDEIAEELGKRVSP